MSYIPPLWVPAVVGRAGVMTLLVDLLVKLQTPSVMTFVDLNTGRADSRQKNKAGGRPFGVQASAGKLLALPGHCWFGERKLLSTFQTALSLDGEAAEPPAPRCSLWGYGHPPLLSSSRAGQN